MEEVRNGASCFGGDAPFGAEAGLAKETSRLLASHLKKGAPMKFRILDDDEGQTTVKLPAPAVGLLPAFLKRWRAATP